MTEKEFIKDWDYFKNVRTVGNLREVIKDLPDDLTIECEVHKLSNTYVIETAYLCGNSVGEPILCLGIKTDWKLTERDEKAFDEWCKSQEDKE